MITALHIERVFDREDALGLKACSRRRCRWEDLSVLHFMTVRYRADGAAAETQPPPCAPPEPRTTGMHLKTTPPCTWGVYTKTPCTS